MKTLFVMHDGTTELTDFMPGATVMRNDIEYVPLELLRHPKTGKCGVRIMVPRAIHPLVNPYFFFDGMTIKRGQ